MTSTMFKQKLLKHHEVPSFIALSLCFKNRQVPHRNCFLNLWPYMRRHMEQSHSYPFYVTCMRNKPLLMSQLDSDIVSYYSKPDLHQYNYKNKDKNKKQVLCFVTLIVHSLCICFYSMKYCFCLTSTLTYMYVCYEHSPGTHTL